MKTPPHTGSEEGSRKDRPRCVRTGGCAQTARGRAAGQPARSVRLPLDPVERLARRFADARLGIRKGTLQRLLRLRVADLAQSLDDDQAQQGIGVVQSYAQRL